MDYQVEILTGDSDGARVVGLQVTDLFCKPGTTHELVVYFGHLDFDIVWNPVTRRQDTIRGVDRYFGGMGEGVAYKVWQHALLASLYDAYQVYDELNTGDTFTCTYNGETAKFLCDGVHVVLLP